MCQGTVFGDLYDEIEKITLNKKVKITHQQLVTLSKKLILSQVYIFR